MAKKSPSRTKQTRLTDRQRKRVPEREIDITRIQRVTNVRARKRERESERHREGKNRRMREDEKEDDEEKKDERGGETAARNSGHLNVSEAVSSAKIVLDG